MDTRNGNHSEMKLIFVLIEINSLFYAGDIYRFPVEINTSQTQHIKIP